MVVIQDAVCRGTHTLLAQAAVVEAAARHQLRQQQLQARAQLRNVAAPERALVCVCACACACVREISRAACVRACTESRAPKPTSLTIAADSRALQLCVVDVVAQQL